MGGMLALLLALFLFSCSEDTAETDEYANWKSRNEAFFATLQDSMALAPAEWKKIITFSKEEHEGTKATDYIYAKVIRSGYETTHPDDTDSVIVSYQGRLIPTASYRQGYVFDGTVYSQFLPETNATKKFLVSSMTDGFRTALQKMPRGAWWRIYVPAELGYGSVERTGIPAYSLLIFDLAMYDYAPAGQMLPDYK